MNATRFTQIIVLFLALPFWSRAQNIISAIHETDDQLQVEIEFTSAPSNIAGDYVLNGGSIAVSSVFVSGTTAFLTLVSSVPVGVSSFSVQYTPSGSSSTSRNDRLIDCADFSWFATNTPTPPCAPVDPINKMVFSVLPGARNSSEWGSDPLQVRVDWTGGTSFILVYESDNSGNPAVNTFFVTGDAALDAFQYPDNQPECSYTSRWVPRIGIRNCGVTNPNQFITYASHNEDNEGNGILSLQPTVANTELVCFNDEADMSFSDLSTLNCIADPNQPNTDMRWVRVIYGDATRPDADRIPNVYVGGVQITDDTGALIAGEYIPTFGNSTAALGTGDAIGVVQFNTPLTELPAGVLDQITTIMTVGESRDVGDQFYVTLEYWNVCNPYTIGNPLNNQVTTNNFIEIIDIPPLPTPVPDEICEGDGLGGINFAITGTGASTAINWYDNDPNLGGNLVANPNGNNSATFPASSFPGGLDTNVPGNYSMWATYVLGATNSCESDPVEVLITVREDLDQPDAFSIFSNSVCNGTNNVTFELPNPAGSTTFGGATEYQWSNTGGAGVNLDATTGQSITVDFNLPGSFTTLTRTIRVRRRYINNPRCNSPFRTITVTVYGQTVGGSTTPDNTICEGDNTGVISLTGEIGTILNWERQVNGTGFFDIGNNGNNSFNENLATAGIYEYRAVVDNGPCTTERSSITTIIVNPFPSIPTISPAPTVDICEDGSTTLTASSNAAADSYQWYRNGVVVGGATNSTIMLGTVAESGSYTVEAIGIAPTNCTSAQSTPTVVTINPLPSASNPVGGGSVCSGNPAPDIVWTLIGTAPFQVTYTDGISTFGPVAEPTNTFTLTNPTTLNAGIYQITALTDANTCSGTSLGGVATIVIGGTPPTFDTPPTLSVSDVCDDGGTTTDPELIFSLDDAGSASQSGFVLTYNIDGGANRTINFDTDASGDPTVSIIFADVELDVTTPSPHVIEITSIVSPAGCLSTFNTPLNFVVNPRPANPTNPVDGIACSDPGTGVALSVDVPPVNTRIRWYRDMALTIDAVPAFGSISGSATRDEIFVPSASTTFTYYAVVESIVGPTFCQSTGFVAVDITEDPNPDPISAQADDQTCDDFYVLSATAASPAGATGFWSTTGTLYYENFDDQLDDATNDAGQFGWTTDISSLVSFTGPGPNDYFAVRSGRFEGLDLGNGSTSAFWFSEIIDVSSINSIDITALLYKNGDLETGDFVEIYYLLDGTPTKFGELVRSVNDVVPPDPALVELPVSSLALDVSGVNNLQLEVRMRSNGGDDIQGFDDIIVREASTSTLTFDDIFDTGTTVRGLQDGANSVFWNIVSEFGVCMPLSEEVIITKIPAPVGVDITDEFCEDTFNGTTTAGIDLSVYDGMVTGGVANRTVQWFSNQTRTIAVPLVPAVTGDPIVTVSNGDIFYPLITETASGDNCINDFSQPGSITFTVFGLPAVVDQDISNPETEFCEDTPGSGVFGAGALPGVDLTTMDDDVANGIVANRTVSWFVDPTYSTAVPNPNDVEVTNGDIFYARITETASGQSCFNDAQVEITVNTRPGNNDIVGNDFQCVDPSSLQIYQITPGPPGTTYTWTIDPLFTQFGGGTINDPFVILQFPTAGMGNISVVETAAFTNVTCDGDIEIKTITVENAPTGLSIVGPDEVCDGEAGVVFSTSSLPNTTYAWTVPVGSSIISGQGSASITVNFGSTGGNVEVIPTSTTGNCSGTVPPKPVTINQRPVLDPNLSKNVCSDDDIQVTLIVDGTSPVAATTYDITASVAPGLSSNFGPTTGTGLLASAIFNDNYNNTTGGPLNVTYVVTPISADNCAGTPVNVVITIDPEPVIASNLNITECSDTPIGLLFNTAAGSAVAVSYNVTAVNIPASVTAAASNATIPQNAVSDNYLATDEYTNTTATAVIVEYTVAPVSANGCVGDPLIINATINPEPVIDPSLNGFACSDGSIGLNLATNGVSVGAMDYNIIGVSVPGGLSASVGNVAIPASNVNASYLAGDAYTNTNTNTLDVVYEVRGVSADGCEGDSEFISITIRPEPVVTPGIVSRVCSDQASGLILSSLASSVAANDYNIISINVPTGAVAAVGNAVIPANNVADNYLNGDTYTNQTNLAIDITYTVRGVSADGCESDDEVVVLTVDPEPVIDPNLDDVLCSGENTGITILTDATSVSAASFDILSITPDALLVTGVSNVAPANGVSANYILNDEWTNNASPLPLDVVYEVRASSASGCQGDIENIVLTYNPEPVLNSALGTTVCSDLPINVNFATNGISVGAANYNLIDVNIPVGVTANGGNATFPANAVATGYITSDLFTNQTNSDLNVVYEVRGVSADGCEGESEFITVVIQPEPVIATNLDDVICSDQAIGLVLNTDGASINAANYNVITVTIDGGLTANVANAVFPANSVADNYLSLDEYTNTTTGPLNVVYRVRGVSSVNCLGDTRDITITINPEPIVNTGLSTTVCSDEVSGINLLTEPVSVGAVAYNIINVTIPAGLTPAGANAVFPANNVPFDYLESDVFTNPGSVSENVVYEVRAVSVDGCVGDSELINLTINPEPVVDPNLDIPVCSDLPIGLIFDTDPSSVTATNYNVLSITVPPALTPGVANVVPANGIGSNYVANDVYNNVTNLALDVLYEVQGISSDGCIGDTRVITVTINPEPVIDNNLDQTVCSDDITGITLNTNGVSIGADTYNLVNVSIPVGLTPDPGNVAFPAAGLSDLAILNDIYNNITSGGLDVIYEVQGVSNGCTGQSEFITVTINPEPVIMPNLDLTECSDVAIGLLLSTTSTSAGAANYDILSVTIDPDLTAAAGNAAFPATGVAANYLQNDSYENVTNAPHSIVYEVRATSADVCLSDIETITVTINPEPVVQIPAPQLAACSDQATGLVFNTDGISTGASNYNILGLTIPGGLAADAGNVVVPATGVAATYVSGHRFTNATSGPLDVIYEVQGVSADGCLGDPVFIPVTIDAGPVVDPNLDAIVCSDTPVGVIFDIFAGSVPAVNYNLVSVTPNPSLTPSVTNAVPAINQADNYIATDTYTNTTSIPLTVSYEVRGVSALGCIGPSEFIVVTIDPEPIVDPNLDRTVCSDQAVGLILATEGSSVGASVYDIVNITVPAGAIPAVTNAIVPFNGVVAGYLSGDIYTNTTNAPLDVIYEVVGVSSSTCPGNSRLITITIDPEPVLDPTVGTIVCSDEIVGVTLNTIPSSVAALSYNVINKTIPGGITQGGSNVPAPANGVGINYFTNDTYTNQTGSSVNVTYEVRPVSADGCIGDSEFVVVRINPEPVVDPNLTASVCSDDVIGIILNTNGISVGADTYDLISVVPDAALVANAGNVSPANGLADNAIQNDTYTNTTSNPLQVIYTVRGRSAVADGDCLGDESTIMVTINPEPVVNPSLDATICSGEISDIVLSTNGVSVAATSYNFTAVNIISGAATPQAGNAAPGGPFNQNVIRNDRFENVGTIDAVVEYRVVPVSPSGCLGEEEVILLTVQPEPILDPSLSPAPVCSDLPSMITLVEQAGTVAAASFNITGIAVQSGLIPGGSNSTIQDGVAANAIFNDSYTNTTNSSLTVTYTIAPVSATGCIGENAQVIFTINPAPEVADLNTITCSDETSEIQLTTSSGSAVAANYEIIDIRPAAGLVPNAGNASIGFTGSNIDYIRNDIFTNPTDNPLTVEYDIAPISGPGCRGPLQVVVLTVEAQPTVIPAPDEAICSQDPTSITLQSNTVPTSGNVTFSVTVSSSGAVTGFTPVRQNLPQGFVIDDTPRNLDNTVSTLTYTITPQMFSAKNGVGCTSGTPIVVTVNVEPEPKLEFSETFISICEGVSLDDINNILSTPTTPSAGNVEFVLNGDPVATGGVTGFSLGGTVYSPGDEITDTFDNPSSANQTVTYRFTPRIVGSTSGTCVGDDVNLVVTVTPRPVVIPDPADLIPSIARPTIEVCSSEPRTIDLPIDIANGISSWTVTDNPDVDGEFESLGNSLFLSLINNSDVPQTITYTVTPFSLFDNSCTGDPIEIDVIVNPLPEVDIFDASPVRCSGDEAGIPLQGVGNFFTWEAQVVSGTVNLPTVSGVGSNGDLIDHVLDNNGTTPAIVRYTIRAFYNKLNADDPGEPQCEGFTPGFVTLTLSPPVNAQITPDPEVGQNTRFRCAGNTEAIEFELFGTAPFQLILDRAENGVITRETLTDLPSRHIILATESVSYTIVRVEDANGCEEFPIDNVDIIFEEALADFEVQYTDPDNGFAFTKNPPQVQMLPNGTATIDIRINNFNPSNIYEFSIGEDIIPVTGPNLTYTFIEPSPFGSIGFLAELNVESPNVSIPCNDSESYFIQVVPAPAIVLAVSDITEGCVPLTVNFESFREDLSLSRNIIVDELVWDFDDGRPTLISPNPTYTFTEAGAYNVVVRGTNGYPGEGNEDQASITIVVQSNPVADFRSNQDVIFIPDQAFRPINNSSTFVTDWLWDWGDGNFTSGTTDEGAATPEHVYELEGQYKVLLTASTDYGNGIVCSDTASLVVTVEEGGFTRTPNAFTPNIDGPPGGSFDPLDPGTAGNINDVFLPITEGVVEFQMVIFDRWGNLVFESNDRNFGWDGYDSKGNLFPAGVYVYRLDLLLSDGNRTTRVGDVTLIR